MPVNIFKKCAEHLQTAYIDMSSKIYVVNMTFMQTMAGKLLMKFLDKDTQSKIFFSNLPNDPDVLKFIDPSQLEERHGGNAPDVTRYWPPIFPEYTDFDLSKAPC